MTALRITVNGVPVQGDVPPETLLVEFLRDRLHLTGTRVGCETAQCGACTVHLDGRPVKGCTVLAVQADGSAVGTIEGLSPPGGPMHPMQEAFRTHHGLQCGFCTSGMVMMAVDIADRLGRPDQRAIREELKGNLCRCTGYHNIALAIEEGARALAVDRVRGRP